MPADPDLLAQAWEFPPRQLHDEQHGPGSHIYRSGNAAIGAETERRDRAVLEHVRRTIVLGLPADRHSGQRPSATAEGFEPTDATAVAYRFVGRTFSRRARDTDAAGRAFKRTVDNLDIAVDNPASHMPDSHFKRLATAQRDLEHVRIQQREAPICSAVDLRQSGKQQANPSHGRALSGSVASLTTRPGHRGHPHARAAWTGLPSNSVFEAAPRDTAKS
jgi:hypothetical protein